MALFIAASLPGTYLSPDFIPYYDRFYPILLLALLTTGEFLLTLLLMHRGCQIDLARLKIPSTQFTITVIIISLLIMLFIAVSGSGLTPDPVSWRQPGSPLLIWQIAGSLLIGILAGFLENRVFPARFHKYLDRSIIILLVTIASIAWMSLPLQTSYTSPRIRPPNFEVYPYSDALFYSLSAESVINGNGLFGWNIVPRPLFITELAYVFAMADGDYQSVINLQSLILALIPIFLYLIGKELHSRPLGITIALLSIFREIAAIYSTPFIPVSNTKLILSDLPTLLIYLMLSLVVIKWVKSTKTSVHYPFVVGGVLGIAMLFRTQSIVLLPFMGILLLIKGKGKAIKQIIIHLLLMVIALTITISPWLIRNYSLTHELIFDDNRQTEWVMGRYEDGSENRQITDSEINNQSILQTVLKNPGFVAQFITNHFFRNVICTLLVIPPTLKSNDLGYLFNSTNWWSDTKIEFSYLEFLCLVLIVIFIAFGISKLIKTHILAGISPIIIFIAYNLSNSLARNSGGRYNLPIDWIGYTYLAAGLLGSLTFIFGLPKSTPTELPPSNSSPKPFFFTHPLLILSIIFLLIGSSIPITESLFALINQGSNEVMLLDQIAEPNVLALAQQLLEDPNVRIISGKAYYPRFYPANEGEPGSSWVAYSPQTFDKLGFLLMNEQGKTDVIYKSNNRPRVFPNRSNVLILGEYQEFQLRGKPQNYFNVRLLIFLDSHPMLYYFTSGK